PDLQSAILALSQLSYCPISYNSVSVLARRSASARRREPCFVSGNYSENVSRVRKKNHNF
ncbi:MAG TPA: hypothetical protein VK568_09310, partial [Thermodesulfobacteriota bacterium]|nr:hypothetical protein [Thermodesulfobacteriota bacterium]